MTFEGQDMDLIISKLADEIERRGLAPAGQPDASPYLTVKEAAAYLRTTPQRIYELTCAKRLPKVKDGGRVLIRRRDLHAWLGDNAGAAA